MKQIIIKIYSEVKTPEDSERKLIKCLGIVGVQRQIKKSKNIRLLRFYMVRVFITILCSPL